MTSKEPDLRRYTELPSLIHILKHQELTLLDPSSWDDKNDSYFLSLYREKRGLKSVLALCFTIANETYHHWRIFAPGSAGVCLQLDAEEIKDAVSKVKGVTIKPVKYLTLPKIRATTLEKSRLPFLKRFAFQAENEVRMLWESKTEKRNSLAVPFNRSSITRITLSPWIHPTLSEELKVLIRSMKGCEKLHIYRSTLIGNEEWMEHGRSAT